MQRFIKVPLLFLFIGSLLGVFLRWQFVSPTAGINYSYFLQAHSHIMFLGWVFNVLVIGFVINNVPEGQQRAFRNIFMVLQVLVIGMLISFPLQGYGFFSILFSTLHTIVAIVFVIKFLKRVKHTNTMSVWYARMALAFFIISTAGPFSLGYLMSAGFGQTQWYYFSIYFYLHFQYNGFFLFGVFSLFFDLLERRRVRFSATTARTVGIILAISCFPAYLLSTLWAKPDYLYYVIAGLAALAQMAALVIHMRFVMANAKEIRQSVSRSAVIILVVAFAAFALKLVLQLISAIPVIAQLAYELRPVTIAYLHLVLVGVISMSLLAWLLECKFLSEHDGRKSVFLFFLSFVGLEICLVMYPWWSLVFGSISLPVEKVTLFFSAILSVSCLLLFLSARPETDKNQVLG